MRISDYTTAAAVYALSATEHMDRVERASRGNFDFLPYGRSDPQPKKPGTFKQKARKEARRLRRRISRH